MEARGITSVAAQLCGFPPCSSIARASNVKPFKSQVVFKNVSHMELVTSLKANNYEVQPMPWGKGFYSRQEHANTAAPYRPSKYACSLVVCSVSHYQRNDVGDVKSVEKKLEKDIVLPVSSEVESLITTICDTTSIAEFKLNLAGFNLYIKRNLVEKNVNVSKHAASPPTSISAQAPVLNGSASNTSLAISKSKPSSGGIQRILDTATDEGLVILQSPKVGYFRRSRTIKGKRAPPSCKEKQEVKEGQVLCYIEQLGGEIPIESDVSGEVIKILRTDGEPVGYGDALIEILPSFPGIKKLQ